MPSTTFLNLSKDKQDNIVSASIEEFSNNLYNKASINTIIKTCNIPRGSFYQYFENKEDLYFYILSLYQEKLHLQMKNSIYKNKGDIIDTFKYLFTIAIKDEFIGENSKFFKNVVLNMDYLMEHKVLLKNKENMDEKDKHFIKCIDKSKLNVSSDKDLLNILNILIILSIHKLIEYIKCNEERKKQVIDNYISQLDLLRKGIYKGE